jgi:peptidoglycan/xylan/chitin deacetylase (PgdA/CDA1 family)
MTHYRAAVPGAAFAPLGAFGPSAKLPARRTVTKIVDLGTTGHGWTANNNTAASSNVNDTTTFARGTQSATIVTKGDGTVASVRNTAMAAIDLTGKRLEVSLMVENWTHVVSLFLYVGDTGFANFRVLNLWNRYSAVAGGSPVTPADNGEWVTLTVDLSSLASTTGTPNLAAVTAMQVAIQDDGSGPATMHVNHVGSFTGSAAYPSGVVSFTFDDSFLSQKTAGLPYLERYNFQGTLYTIIDKLDANPYYLTTSHLRTAHDTAAHEVAAHAFTSAAHDGSGGFTALSPAALDQELRLLKNWLVTNRFRGHNHLALPQGATNRSVETAAASYFSSNRGTLSVPVETLLPGNPLRLRTGFKLNTPSTLAQAKAAVDAAYANGSWLILTTHDLVTTAPTPAGTTLVQWDIASFQQLVDYIASKGIPVRTVGDVLATA